MRTSTLLRHALTVAVAAGTTLGLLVATPAYAAPPALNGGGYVRAQFVVDTGKCSVTGTDKEDQAKVTVASSGSRSFTSKASGKLTAIGVDPSDKVTLTGKGVAEGTARAAGGAFASLSATLSASATISSALSSTECAPQSATTVGAVVNARVKKTGKITVTMTVRDGGSAEILVAPAGSLGGGDVSTTLRPGTYTISYPVRPGTYVVAVALQATASRAAPWKTVKASTGANVSAAYRAG